MSKTALLILAASCILLGVSLGFLVATLRELRARRKERRRDAVIRRGARKLLFTSEDRAFANLLTRQVKNEQEPLEGYIQFGVFFRQQGEYGRAIKLHSCLLERSNLPDEARVNILLELASDYAALGQVGKAQKQLTELFKLAPGHKEAENLAAELSRQYQDAAGKER